MVTTLKLITHPMCSCCPLILKVARTKGRDFHRGLLSSAGLPNDTGTGRININNVIE